MIYCAAAKWSIKGKQTIRKNGPWRLHNRENDSQSQLPASKSAGIQHQRERSQATISKNKCHRVNDIGKTRLNTKSKQTAHPVWTVSPSTPSPPTSISNLPGAQTASSKSVAVQVLISSKRDSKTTRKNHYSTKQPQKTPQTTKQKSVGEGFEPTTIGDITRLLPLFSCVNGLRTR